MAVQVYRCDHCGREVLVREPGPLSEAEIARRVEEEMRPSAPGARAPTPVHDRLRDDIWLAVSDSRQPIPRETLPELCPACGRDALEEARTLE